MDYTRHLPTFTEGEALHQLKKTTPICLGFQL